jgi:hypothetical protein
VGAIEWLAALGSIRAGIGHRARFWVSNADAKAGEGENRTFASTD